ncbi:MAG: CAP domain-containing protein [Nitrososphaeraceae archaeon]
MRCSHNYVYTQGHFYCTKCGKRTYGHSRKKRQLRKIGIGITGVCIVGFIGFLFVNDVFEFNQDNLVRSIQNIPQELPEITLAVPKNPLIDNVDQIIPKIKKEISKIEEQTENVIKPELDIAKIELLIHENTNKERIQHGLTSLEFDNKISDIARMHSQDMAKNNYFAHQSPTGKEPWDRGFPYGYNICGTKDAISLQNKYDELSIQYDRYPKTISDPSQYQQAMSLYNQLNTISSKLNSYVGNKELFGGLAENIFQNWTYDSITYVSGIPIYNWNTEEEIAKQTVDGWMNSKGHRENILRGFHGEGIGVAVASDDKVYITQNFC